MTSPLFFDDSGNRFDNCHFGFCLAQAKVLDNGRLFASVSRNLMIDDVEQSLDEQPLDSFLQKQHRPFDIQGKDRVYLNPDCLYETNLIDAISIYAHDEQGIPVEFVFVKAENLDALGLALTAQERRRFSYGSPIWHCGARKAGGRGVQSASATQKALGDAIQAYSVIAEQIARHSFERAARTGKAFCNRHQDTTRTAERFIGCALGYHYLPGDAVDGDELLPVPVGLREWAINDLNLKPIAFEAARTEARRNQFAQESGKSKDTPYAENSEKISRAVAFNIDNFETIYRDKHFDWRAIAQWNYYILIFLRFAQKYVAEIDNKRTKFRDLLQDANTDTARRSAEIRFLAERYTGVAFGPDDRKVKIAGSDILGLREDAIMALLANIDPRAVHSSDVKVDGNILDALFSIARWFGALQRVRRAFLSPERAQDYLMLADILRQQITAVDGLDEETGVGDAFQTVRSFLTDEAAMKIEDGARDVVSSGLGRMVYAEDFKLPGHNAIHAPSASASGLSRLQSVVGANLRNAVPTPIIAVCGRLLLPSDYAEAWVGRCADVLRVLDGKD